MRSYLGIMLCVLLQAGFSAVGFGKIDTVKVQSVSMKKIIPNLVVTPSTYDAGTGKYPVFYLLHGAYGSFKQWVQIEPALQRYADQYQMIIVCPDGGNTSWYFDSPVDASMKYETYVAKELVGYVDKQYRTVADKKGRAISGLSMGGHGAFYLAIRNADTWGAAGSTSGGLDFRAFPNNWDIPKRLGTYAERKQNWEDNTVINLVQSLKGRSIQLMFDCGVNDFFLDANRRTHTRLLELGIPHIYIEMPGEHNSAYWSTSLRYHFVFAASFFKK